MTDAIPADSPSAHNPGVKLNLDDLVFDMISSTASEVSSQSPTRFRYQQEGALVWGEYTGDTVTQGRMVGRTVGNTIEISFAHAMLSDGSVVMGAATSVAELRADGLIYLVEEFEKNGETHQSVCVQVV